MIKKLLLGTVALGAMSTAAFAADLPSRRAPPVYVPPPIPVFSWTGFYVGGDVGYAFGNNTATLRAATGAGPTVGLANHPHGAIGGGHIGYNLSTQGLGLGGAGLFGGGLVIGVEADIDGTDYRGSNAAPGFLYTNRKEVEGSARGRVGVAVDRALFFATGGAAFTQFRTDYNYFATPVTTNLNQTRVGYTVGGGVEYAITTQWSLRAEYRYSDFGTYRQTIASNTGPVVASSKNVQQRATVGFSYKFDVAPAPVVARY